MHRYPVCVVPIFEVQNPVALNTLCIPPPISMGIYQFSRQNLHIQKPLVPYSLLPPALAATILCVSKKLTTLGTSEKWSHSLCLLCLIYFSLYNVLRIHPLCENFFLSWNNTPRNNVPMAVNAFPFIFGALGYLPSFGSHQLCSYNCGITVAFQVSAFNSYGCISRSGVMW